MQHLAIINLYVFKINGPWPSGKICFSKVKGNLLKFPYSLPLHKISWYSLKEKIHAEFTRVAMASHATLALANCKQ